MAIIIAGSLTATSFVNTDSTPASLQDDDQRVILITLDGYRWQELYGGADSLILNNGDYTKNEELMKQKFWRPTAEQRRSALMPFVWSYISKNGIMLGDRYANGLMRVANGMHFSYPGYNEDLCGYPDDEHINSNEKKYNPNVSILEVANKTPQYKGSVLAFGSWDVFPYILNEKRSGLEVNAGYRHSMSKSPTEKEKYLDELEDCNPRYWRGERFDYLTYAYAMEALKSRHPKFIFIGMGETDEWAHAGNYDLYLESAYNSDTWIRKIWEYTQSDPFYKGKTTFIITCGHGRGRAQDNARNWCDHGQEVPHSEETWMMVFGNKVPAKGIVTDGKVYYNKQIAPTVAKILGVKFEPNHPDAGKAITF